MNGFEPMLLVADNLTVTNPTIAAALEHRDPGPIHQLVQRCEKAGAQAIDLNSGPLTKAPEETFAFLVETVQTVTRLPLVLDTTNPKALRAGLNVCRNKAIINGFSLEPAKLVQILPLAKEFEVDIIGYLLHPDSRVAMEADDMMTVAVDLFDAYTSAGLDPQRLIIDPVIAPLSWDQGLHRNRAILDVLRNLTDLLGTPVRSIAGLSNLTSGVKTAERKIALETAYLPMLAAAGLNAILLNMQHKRVIMTAQSSTALLDDTVFSWADIGL